MDDDKYLTVRFLRTDMEWLKTRAESHHRSAQGEFSAIRDLITRFEGNESAKMDVLPHPEGAQVIPVQEFEP